MTAPTEMDPTRRALSDAVIHVLRRIQQDADVRYVMGPGTEAFQLLCVAWAHHTGEPLADVLRKAKLDHCTHAARVVELKERLAAAGL